MTTSLTLRGVKGSALTYTEVDTNFSNLGTTADGAATAAATANATLGNIAASGIVTANEKPLGLDALNVLLGAYTYALAAYNTAVGGTADTATNAVKSSAATAWTTPYAALNATLTAGGDTLLAGGVRTAWTTNLTSLTNAITILTAGLAQLPSATGRLGVIKPGSGCAVGSDGTLNITGATGGTGATWGAVTGTLSAQSDLQAALNAKLGSTAQAADSAKLNGQTASYYATASALSTYAALTGATFSGTIYAPMVQAKAAGATASLYITTDAGYAGGLVWYQNGHNRNVIMITTDGSVLQTLSYDSSGTVIDTPLIIPNSSGGAISINRPMTVSGVISAPTVYAAATGASSSFYLSTDAGYGQSIVYRQGGHNRNSIALASDGSAFTLASMDASGNAIDNPITIPNTANAAIAFTRPLTATGAVTSNVGLFAVSTTAGAGIVVDSASGYSGGIIYKIAGVNRNNLNLSPDGNTFSIVSYTSGGTLVDSPVSIPNTAGGTVTIVRPVTVSGLLTASAGISGTTAAFSGTASLAGMTATTGTFSGLLTANGGVSATTGTFSSSLSATTGTFSGNASSPSHSFTGATPATDGTNYLYRSGTDLIWRYNGSTPLNGTVLHTGNLTNNAAALQAVIAMGNAPSVGLLSARPAAATCSGAYYYATDDTAADGQAGTMYKSNGTTWTLVGASAMIAGRIVAGNISAGAIGAQALAANTVMASQVLCSQTFTSGGQGAHASGSATITGSISAYTLTVTAYTGTILMGMAITSGVLAGTRITSFMTGSGGNGTYGVSLSQTATLTAATASLSALSGAYTSNPTTWGVPGSSTGTPLGWAFYGQPITTQDANGTTFQAIGEIGGNVNFSGYQLAALGVARLYYTSTNAASGGGSGRFTTGGTWVAPAMGSATAYDIVITLQAGGGGGGGTQYSLNNPASGGGGGGYVKQRVTVVPGTSYAVTVGAAGTAGAAGGGTGGNGGDSSFIGGAVSLIAKGGVGGGGTAFAGGAGGDSVSGKGDGGAGGATPTQTSTTTSVTYIQRCPGAQGGYGGTANSPGGNADSGNTTGGLGMAGGMGARGGGGGASAMGNGGNAGTTTGSNGVAGSGYGSGGGAATCATWSAPDYAGGAGAPGIAIIEFV